MHDLILALFFVSLLVTPAIMAAISGKEPTLAARATPNPSTRGHNRNQQGRFTHAATLPLRGTRALGGR